ncbi:MAG: MBL fold metallo-hydrolase [Candidatus Hodarchaeota archaeon]
MFKYSNSQQWFETIKHKEHLYVIRERLDEIDPRFYTTYTNLYLIVGSHSALLIDTGCGLFPLKPIIADLIKDKKLMVLNTHSHFDHIGGNHEFREVYIHNEELKSLSTSFDISFLQNSSKEIVKRYEKRNFTIPRTNNIKSLKDEEIIDLGDITVIVIHTPGHSPGSVSLLTNKNELFTGDTAHYGTMYLTKNYFPIILTSISKLLDLFQKTENIELYPSHEEFAVDRKLLEVLYNGVNNIEKLWETRVWDNFLEAWIIDDENLKYAIF